MRRRSRPYYLDARFCGRDRSRPYSFSFILQTTNISTTFLSSKSKEVLSCCPAQINLNELNKLNTLHFI
ncbi:MAG: hypothetical protein IKB57_07275, partial [Bacteroidaceae bacterium]|nr:hypothetical protein [Bacteroidaceae bacterium]